MIYDFFLIVTKHSKLYLKKSTEPPHRTRAEACVACQTATTPPYTYKHALFTAQETGEVFPFEPRLTPSPFPSPAQSWHVIGPHYGGGFRPVCFGGERWGKLKFNRTCRAVMRRRRQHFTFSNYRIRSMYT